MIFGKKKKKCDGCDIGCQNDRIKSKEIFHCNTLIVRQDFCVSSLVGASECEEPEALQIDTTIFSAPADPIRPPLLLTVVARNISVNPVNVQMLSSDLEDVLVEATVTPNSEVALSAPNAARLVAAAEAPSRVLFFITVYLPVDPILPPNPI